MNNILFILLILFGGTLSYLKAQSGNIIRTGKTIETRFRVPDGYKRTAVAKGSFAEYLRTLPLKPVGHKTLYYNGQEKHKKVQCGVVDMEIGTRNLQQCADAVIRLRAEYLYASGQYGKIHFNLTNGFRVDYSKWAKGYRVRVKGNTTTWYKPEKEDNSYSTFRKYLDFVFTYAGTASLYRELSDTSDIAIGDVLIQGGHPGHAVIVVDMVQNAQGEKWVILAQSYMPAQEIEILEYTPGFPWFPQPRNGKPFRTPEWTFGDADNKLFIKRF